MSQTDAWVVVDITEPSSCAYPIRMKIKASVDITNNKHTSVLTVPKESPTDTGSVNSDSSIVTFNKRAKSNSHNNTITKICTLYLPNDKHIKDEEHITIVDGPIPKDAIILSWHSLKQYLIYNTFHSFITQSLETYTAAIADCGHCPCIEGILQWLYNTDVYLHEHCDDMTTAGNGHQDSNNNNTHNGPPPPMPSSVQCSVRLTYVTHDHDDITVDTQQDWEEAVSYFLGESISNVNQNNNNNNNNVNFNSPSRLFNINVHFGLKFLSTGDHNTTVISEIRHHGHQSIINCDTSDICEGPNAMTLENTECDLICCNNNNNINNNKDDSTSSDDKWSVIDYMSDSEVTVNGPVVSTTGTKEMAINITPQQPHTSNNNNNNNNTSSLGNGDIISTTANDHNSDDNDTNKHDTLYDNNNIIHTPYALNMTINVSDNTSQAEHNTIESYVLKLLALLFNYDKDTHLNNKSNSSVMSYLYGLFMGLDQFINSSESSDFHDIVFVSSEQDGPNGKYAYMDINMEKLFSVATSTYMDLFDTADLVCETDIPQHVDNCDGGVNPNNNNNTYSTTDTSLWNNTDKKRWCAEERINKWKQIINILHYMISIWPRNNYVSYYNMACSICRYYTDQQLIIKTITDNNNDNSHNSPVNDEMNENTNYNRKEEENEEVKEEISLTRAIYFLRKAYDNNNNNNNNGKKTNIFDDIYEDNDLHALLYSDEIHALMMEMEGEAVAKLKTAFGKLANVKNIKEALVNANNDIDLVSEYLLNNLTTF